MSLPQRRSRRIMQRGILPDRSYLLEDEQPEDSVWHRDLTPDTPLDRAPNVLPNTSRMDAVSPTILNNPKWFTYLDASAITNSKRISEKSLRVPGDSSPKLDDSSSSTSDILLSKTRRPTLGFPRKRQASTNPSAFQKLFNDKSSGTLNATKNLHSLQVDTSSEDSLSFKVPTANKRQFPLRNKGRTKTNKDADAHFQSAIDSQKSVQDEPLMPTHKSSGQTSENSSLSLSPPLVKRKSGVRKNKSLSKQRVKFAFQQVLAEETPFNSSLELSQNKKQVRFTNEETPQNKLNYQKSVQKSLPPTPTRKSSGQTSEDSSVSLSPPLAKKKSGFLEKKSHNKNKQLKSAFQQVFEQETSFNSSLESTKNESQTRYMKEGTSRTKLNEVVGEEDNISSSHLPNDISKRSASRVRNAAAITSPTKTKFDDSQLMGVGHTSGTFQTNASVTEENKVSPLKQVPLTPSLGSRSMPMLWSRESNVGAKGEKEATLIQSPEKSPLLKLGRSSVVAKGDDEATSIRTPAKSPFRKSGRSSVVAEGDNKATSIRSPGKSPLRKSGRTSVGATEENKATLVRSPAKSPSRKSGRTSVGATEENKATLVRSPAKSPSRKSGRTSVGATEENKATLVRSPAKSPSRKSGRTSVGATEENKATLVRSPAKSPSRKSGRTSVGATEENKATLVRSPAKSPSRKSGRTSVGATEENKATLVRSPAKSPSRKSGRTSVGATEENKATLVRSPAKSPSRKSGRTSVGATEENKATLVRSPAKSPSRKSGRTSVGATEENKATLVRSPGKSPSRKSGRTSVGATEENKATLIRSPAKSPKKVTHLTDLENADSISSISTEYPMSLTAVQPRFSKSVRTLLLDARPNVSQDFADSLDRGQSAGSDDRSTEISIGTPQGSSTRLSYQLRNSSRKRKRSVRHKLRRVSEVLPQGYKSISRKAPAASVRRDTYVIEPSAAESARTVGAESDDGDAPNTPKQLSASRHKETEVDVMPRWGDDANSPRTPSASARLVGEESFETRRLSKSRTKPSERSVNSITEISSDNTSSLKRLHSEANRENSQSKTSPTKEVSLKKKKSLVETFNLLPANTHESHFVGTVEGDVSRSETKVAEDSDYYDDDDVVVLEHRRTPPRSPLKNLSRPTQSTQSASKVPVFTSKQGQGGFDIFANLPRGMNALDYLKKYYQDNPHLAQQVEAEKKRHAEESAKLLQKVKARHAAVAPPPKERPPAPVRRAPRPVHPELMVDGKPWRAPKLLRPKRWANDRFYKVVMDKCAQQWGELSKRRRAQSFVVHFCEVVSKAIRCKKNFECHIQKAKLMLYKLGAIKTLDDFHVFIADYLPEEFRYKAIPTLRAYGIITGLQSDINVDRYADLNL